MGEGWETQRRRDAGHDYAIFRLAFAGQVRQLIVDTAHFKYNASAEVAAYGCGGDAAPPAGSPDWQPLLARTRLQPDTRHVLPVSCPGPVAWVRIDAFPDGGLSRVRVIGSIDPAARSQAGYRWLNSLPVGPGGALPRRRGAGARPRRRPGRPAAADQRVAGRLPAAAPGY